MSYTREDARWVQPQGDRFFGHSNNDGFDPIADPDYGRHLDGSTVAYGQFSPGNSHEPGRPASTAFGHVLPEVKYLAVIQGGQQDYRLPQSHFGRTGRSEISQSADAAQRAFDIRGLSAL